MLCVYMCVCVPMRVHEPVRWPDLARLWGLQTAASLAAQGRVWWVYAWSRGSRERGGRGGGHVCLCRCFDIRLCYNHNVFTWSATASAPCTRPVRQVHLICLLNLQNMRRRCRTAGFGRGEGGKEAGNDLVLSRVKTVSCMFV